MAEAVAGQGAGMNTATASGFAERGRDRAKTDYARFELSRPLVLLVCGIWMFAYVRTRCTLAKTGECAYEDR